MTATVKISALPVGSAVGASDLIPMVQGGVTVQQPASALKSFTNSGVGTVTSVALTAPAEFTVSGSPVTTSGALAVTKANQSANQVWAGPTSGGAAAPAFRALVGADLPNPGASSLGGVQSIASASHLFLNAISTSGAPSAAQPAFADLAGAASIAQGASRLILLAKATGLNFNSTSDQAIAITGTSAYVITQIIVANASTSLTTAAGGFYAAAGKTTPLFNTSSGGGFLYLTASSKALVYGGGGSNGGTNVGNTLFYSAPTTIYLSLTTPQGGAATADAYVFGFDCE